VAVTRWTLVLACAAVIAANALGERSVGDALAAQSLSSTLPITVQYQPSVANFPNPERGFYRQFSPFELGAARTPLSSSTLRQVRDEGIALVRAYYIIDEFRTSPLSPDALAALTADFAAVRSAGVKIIPRFTYSFPCVGSLEPCNPSTYGQTDVPVERVLAHLDQLAPVLTANADVIAFMEMGLIGAWGEWHDSTSGLLASAFTVNQSSAAIALRLLAALPPRRMANIPLWHQKQAIVGNPNPLTPEQAFTGTAQARIGHQDDCLLANATNGNTYVNHNPPMSFDPEPARQYLSVDNRNVPQSGESCSYEGEAQRFISCGNALTELARTRWSALNVGYQPQVLDVWRQQGCFSDVARRLGYRFRLTSADVPAQAAVGGVLALRVGVVNDGFASPYNPRSVEVVLRHASSGQEHTIPVSADPRRWGGGESRTLDLVAPIPTTIAPGSYQVLLNLPDPEPTLRGRPEYSIRLANEGVWEATTGYNDLLARVEVVVGTVAEAPVFQPAAVVGTTVTLQWSHPQPGDVLEYVLEAGSAPGASNLYNASVGAATSLTTSAPSGVYFVRVRARGPLGVGAPSNEVTFAIGEASAGCSGPPATPTAVTASVSSGTARLSWPGAPGATSYVVQVGLAPGGTDLFNGNVGGQMSVSGAVAAGFRAYGRVIAVNACGQSAASADVLIQ
jgi:hypothetical protein